MSSVDHNRAQFFVTIDLLFDDIESSYSVALCGDLLYYKLKNLISSSPRKVSSLSKYSLVCTTLKLHPHISARIDGPVTSRRVLKTAKYS